MADRPVEQVIIVGSGPAGYTAALYTARADLSPLVFEGFAWGGLLQQTTAVENYPGFPEGVMGPDLMASFRAQAERFGARLQTVDAERIELGEGANPIHRVYANGEEYRTRALIVAMGAQHRKLGVPGEEEYGARGVSYCATCDAAFFRDLPTVVVGGGDSAMEEALFLSKFSSRVVLIHRREGFRASAIMVDRVRARENIDLLIPYTVEEILGDAGGMVRAVRLRHAGDGSAKEVPVRGVFVAIGLEPQSSLLQGQLELDEAGYVKVEGLSSRTSVAGVFAAGDLVDRTYRQAVTAAGSGCKAALDAEWYLRDTAPVAALASAA